MGLYEANVNISQSTVSNNLPTVKKHPREDEKRRRDMDTMETMNSRMITHEAVHLEPE